MGGALNLTEYFTFNLGGQRNDSILYWERDDHFCEIILMPYDADIIDRGWVTLNILKLFGVYWESLKLTLRTWF